MKENSKVMHLSNNIILTAIHYDYLSRMNHKNIRTSGPGIKHTNNQ